MAYGNPRRRSDQDGDVRDIVEDAAREAGLSVPEFLAQAAAEQEEERPRRKPPARRELRLVPVAEGPLDALERRLRKPAREDERPAEPRDDGLSEDRIAGILEKAFNEIRASEARTAELIGSIARAAPQPAAARRPPQSVAEILASAERRARGAQNVVELPSARSYPQAEAQIFDEPPGLGGVVARLQEGVSRHEVEKALKLLERQLSLVEPQGAQDRVALAGMSSEIAAIRAVVTAEGAQVPLAAIERPIESLTARIGALIAAPRQAPAPAAAAPTPPVALSALDKRLDEVTATTAAMVNGIQDELVRLGRNGLKRDDVALEASFDRLENRILQLEEASRVPLETIRREIRSLQDSPARRGADEGLRDSVVAVEQKLEQLTERIARPLQMVHNAVTHLTRQKAQGPADDGRLDQLFSELSALKRGIAEQGPGVDISGMERQLAVISKRIESIAHRMQEQQAEPEAPRDPRRKSIDDELAEIKLLLNVAKSPCDDTKVLDAIGQLERKIASLENSPQALMDRLDRLQARLEERPAAAPASQLPANLEVLLRNLAARLESQTTNAAPAPVDDLGMDRLQQEIRVLASRLDQAPTAPAAPAQDLSGVERSIGDLFRQIDGLKFEVGEKAARAAAEAVRDMQPVFQPAPLLPTPAPVADTSHIETSLGHLRQQQAEAEQRTTRTLEALHDTLHRVVDRLGAMEQDSRTRAAPPPAPPTFSLQALQQAMPETFPQAMPQGILMQPAPPPPPVFAPPAAEPPPVLTRPAAEPVRMEPAPFDDTQNLLPPDILAPRLEAPQFETPRPEAPRPENARAAAPQREPDGQRSFADTLASLRATTAGKAAAIEAKPEARSAMASAFAAAKDAMANLRAGKPGEPARAEPKLDASPAAAAPLAAQAPAAALGDFDMPLEPGSGRPRPGAQPQPTAQSAGPDSDPKAEFLAAARRAAQTAAQQSAEVIAQAEGRADTKAGRKARAAAAGPNAAARESAPKPSAFRAKHAALLGAAALIVAGGAGYQFLAAPKRAEAPKVERNSALAPVRTPAESRPQASAAAPIRMQQADAPRQILPPPLTPEPQRPPERTAERRDAPAATAPAAVPAREEPPTVGSIPAPERVPAGLPAPVDPNDPLLRFEGLKDAQKLRDAARRGDPSAFVELGQRYAEGRGAARDPKAAAQWFEKASANGSAPATYRLGALYREGRGVERNPKTALKHFTEAAEAGNARAMHNAAVLMAEGVNGAPDYAGAAEWFRKAAEFGIKDSQYNLAILHARGLGVGQDLMSSYAWFSAAATSGDEDAAKKRDEVGSRMSAERLQQARAAAAQWKPKTPDPAANEIVAPPGGWDGEVKQAPPAAAAPKAAPKRG